MKKLNKILFTTAVLGSAIGLSNQVLAETRTVTIVTSGTSMSYSMLDADGNWTGVDAELWAAIAKRKDWKLNVKRTTFDAIFGELDAGRADVASNAFAVKPERVNKYYPSIPYYGDAQAVIVKGDNQTITKLIDLKGKKIGVTNGQAAQTIINEMQPSYGFEQVIYESSDNGLMEMVLGRIDAQACAVSTANQFAERTGNNIRILDEKLRANNVALFFPKTEQGMALRDEINQEITALLQDGTIAKITEKYLGADMTKLIINE